jgi:hypothetical protein
MHAATSRAAVDPILVEDPLVGQRAQAAERRNRPDLVAGEHERLGGSGEPPVATQLPRERELVDSGITLRQHQHACKDRSRRCWPRRFHEDQRFHHCLDRSANGFGALMSGM